MKKRLRKKLRIKEFTIREFDLFVKFAGEMPDDFVDKFLDHLCDEVDKRKIYFAGVTHYHSGHYTLFIDDFKRQPEALDIMYDLVNNISRYLIESVQLTEVTNFSDKQLEELWSSQENEKHIHQPSI